MFFCKSVQEGEVVVVQKGLITLIKVSNVKQQTCNRPKDCTVHKFCRIKLRRSSIKASTWPEVGEPAAKVSRARPREFRFDCIKQCIFIQEVENTNLKLSKNKRRQRQVETNEMKNVILKVRENRNDELGEIVTRITSVKDLVSEQARYNLNYYT